MFNIVLYQPEIPPNTGNIIRLCANTGCQLHLIEPLGFELQEKALRRAGLDYHEFTQVKTWTDWQAFYSAQRKQHRIFLFTTKVDTVYTQVQYKPGDYLLFGAETRGVGQEVNDTLNDLQRVTLPMHPNSRSLNLSNSAAIAVYEAWRQNDFAIKPVQ